MSGLASRLREKYSIRVDIHGTIYRLLPQYKFRALQLCSLIMLAFWVYILRSLTYHPITIIGNSVYSKLTAAVLSEYQIPYVRCKETHRFTYYETDEGRIIPFEGSSIRQYRTNKNPIIPLSSEELDRLQSHIGCSSVNCIHSKILDRIADTTGQLNGIRMNPVIRIQRLVGSICYVMTTDNLWLTQLVITDRVSPLHPGETVVSTNWGKTDSENQRIVTRDGCSLFLNHHSRYQVDSNLEINTVHSVSQPESMVYHLLKPRPFQLLAPIVHVHPFHLPFSWDPFLSIMITTCALVEHRFSYRIPSSNKSSSNKETYPQIDWMHIFDSTLICPWNVYVGEDDVDEDIDDEVEDEDEEDDEFADDEVEDDVDEDIEDVEDDVDEDIEDVEDDVDEDIEKVEDDVDEDNVDEDNVDEDVEDVEDNVDEDNDDEDVEEVEVDEDNDDEDVDEVDEDNDDDDVEDEVDDEVEDEVDEDDDDDVEEVEDDDDEDVEEVEDDVDEDIDVEVG